MPRWHNPRRSKHSKKIAESLKGAFLGGNCFCSTRRDLADVSDHSMLSFVSPDDATTFTDDRESHRSSSHHLPPMVRANPRNACVLIMTRARFTSASPYALLSEVWFGVNAIVTKLSVKRLRRPRVSSTLVDRSARWTAETVRSCHYQSAGSPSLATSSSLPAFAPRFNTALTRVRAVFTRC